MVIPAFNCQEFVAQAVASVLAQNRAVQEILVIDDGSTDGTGEVVARLPVRYHCQANAGPAAARNQGLARTTGDLVAFLDADDLWSPDNLHLLAEALARDPQACMAQGLVQKMQREEDGWKPTGRPYQFVNLGSVLFRRQAFALAGGFAEELRANEDTDWFLKAWELDLKKLVLPHVALFYRIHQTNMVHAQGDARSALPGLLRRHLSRTQGAKVPGRPSWESYRG